MADLSYSIGINTSEAQRSLDGLRNAIAGFGAALASAFTVREIVGIAARFEDLRLTLNTVYRDAGRGSAVFEDIKNFAKTSAFAVEDLVQTVIKLKTAGLEPNIALLRLFADVSGSVADKVGALQAITDLYARTQAGGLGLEDLNRLADRGIPVFTILQERLGLARLEISKLGQSAEGAQLILKALEVGLAAQFSGATAAKANSLTQAISNFKDTLNNLIDVAGRYINQPLADFINNLGQAFERAIPYIAAFGAVIASAFKSLSQNIELVTTLLKIFLGLLAVTAIAGFVKLLLTMGRAVLFVATGFGLLNTVLSKNPFVKAAQILGILGAGAAGFGIAEMSGQFDNFKKNYEDLVKTIEVDLASALEKNKPKGLGLPTGELTKDTGDFKNQVGALNSELNKFRAEMNSVVDAYGRQLQSQRKSFDQQTELIGATEEQRISIEELRNAQENYLNTIQPLLDQYAKLSASANKEDLAKLPLIQAALKGVTQAYEESLGPLQASLQLRIQRLMVERELVYQAELLNKIEERRLNADQAINEVSLRGAQEVKKATDAYINSTLTPLQRRLAEIRQEEIALRDSTIKRIAEQAGDDPASAEAFASAVEKISQATERNIQIRQQQARDELAYQKSWTAGWIKAYRDYAQAAADNSQTAARLFNKTVQGMEDLFVNFAKTGKFQWKNFLNDLGEEILRSQLRQLFSGIFGDMTKAMDSGSGFMGMLGKLMGFDGGRGSSQNPLYVIDMASVKGGMGVGSNQGGGFFDTILGGIKSIGSSIWDGVKSIGSSILGAFGGGGGGGGGFFSSIVKGISSLFGGFFANGGTLGAGKFGIAGERGPELITGPATVTPMMGSSTVVYNINAVDALSFKQMLARDPSYIHGLVQQGAKTVSRRY